MRIAWKPLVLAALLVCAYTGVALSDESEDVEEIEIFEAAEDDYADEEAAFILIKHHIDTDPVVEGRNITVDLEVYNVGNGTATEVTLHGADWDATVFEILSGNPAASWEEIKPKAGESLQYTVVAKSSGPQQMPLTKVTYKPESDGKLQTANGPRTPFYVLSVPQLWQQRGLKVGAYASLGQIQTKAGWLKAGIFSGATAALVGGYWLWTKMSSARQKHKYNRAYAEVSKYE